MLQSDRDHYFSEEKREREEVDEKPEVEKEECLEILEKYGVSKEASRLVVRDLCKDRESWVQVSAAFFYGVVKSMEVDRWGVASS